MQKLASFSARHVEWNSRPDPFLKSCRINTLTVHPAVTASNTAIGWSHCFKSCLAFCCRPNWCVRYCAKTAKTRKKASTGCKERLNWNGNTAAKSKDMQESWKASQAVVLLSESCKALNRILRPHPGRHPCMCAMDKQKHSEPLWKTRQRTWTDLVHQVQCPSSIAKILKEARSWSRHPLHHHCQRHVEHDHAAGGLPSNIHQYSIFAIQRHLETSENRCYYVTDPSGLHWYKSQWRPQLAIANQLQLLEIL
jgi:hypothetical protein